METKETNMEEMQAHFGRASKEIQDSVLAGYKTIANNIRFVLLKNFSKYFN